MKLFAVSVLFQEKFSRSTAIMWVKMTLARNEREAKNDILARAIEKYPEGHRFKALAVEASKEQVEHAFEAIHPFVPLTPVVKAKPLTKKK